LRLAWRGPAVGFRAGTPALVELVVSGQGNVTLWPAPTITWPPGLRVYSERTEESATNTAGRLGGEKRFRFTVVADSEGVIALPRVRYPFFDPQSVDVSVTAAAAASLPVLPVDAADGSRERIPIGSESFVPMASRVVSRGWGALALLVVVPFLVVFARRRRPAPAARPEQRDPESELRILLGTPLDASPDRVGAALRRRGVARNESDEVRQWVGGGLRRRYGPGVAPDAAPPPGALARILTMLRRATLGTSAMVVLIGAPLLSQRNEGVERYRAGDYAGAARAFQEHADSVGIDVVAWRNVAAARWMNRDEVGASAAWLRALSLAPRDRTTRAAWARAASIPQDVRAMAPSVPLSLHELVILAALAWVAMAYGISRNHRRMAMGCGVLAITAAVVGGMRWHEGRAPRGLARPGARLYISPHPSSPVVGDIGTWTLATVDRRAGGWVLVHTADRRNGWILESSIAPLGKGER